MTLKTYALAAAFCAAAGFAQANELSGSLAAQYNKFGGGKAVEYTGSVEYAASQQFSIAADLTGYSITNASASPQDITLHGIYHMSNFASLGVFAGQTKVRDAKTQNYGLEFGSELSGASIEAFAGQAKAESGSKSTFVGGIGEYALNNGYTLLGEFNYTDLAENSGSVTTFGIGSSYDIANGPSVYALSGLVSAKDANNNSASGSYIAIGAEIAFGNSRGSTFSARNIIGASFGF